MKVEIPFTWNPEIWYTMIMQVEIESGTAKIKGKVWPRDEKAPSDWTITAEDPNPNTHGSPGLYGDAQTTIFFDNVKVTQNN